MIIVSLISFSFQFIKEGGPSPWWLIFKDFQSRVAFTPLMGPLCIGLVRHSVTPIRYKSHSAPIAIWIRYSVTGALFSLCPNLVPVAFSICCVLMPVNCCHLGLQGTRTQGNSTLKGRNVIETIAIISEIWLKKTHL